MIRKALTVITVIGLIISLSLPGIAAPYYTIAGWFGNPQDEADSYTLSTPVAISRDSSGNYYVADLAKNRVIKLNASFEWVDSLENINMPLFVYVDNQDNVLVNELATHSVKKYTSDFQFITQWGSYGSGNGQFSIPRSIVQDSLGNYYVSDELNHRIQKFTSDGEFLEAYGEYGSSPGQFKVQQGLSIDAQDRLYVADTYNSRIQVFQTAPTFTHLKSFGTYGVYNPFNYYSFQPGIMNHPRGVYVEKETGRVVVADSSNSRVMVYNNYDRNFSFYQSQNAAVNMALPSHAILVNNYVIAIDSHSRILKFNSLLNNTTNYTNIGRFRYTGGTLSNPQSVAAHPTKDRIFVNDSFNNRISVFSKSGDYIYSYGGVGGPYGYGTNINFFHYPKQVTVSNQGTLYVADYANARVVALLDDTVSFFPVVTAPLVGLPWGVAIDNASNLYVTDQSDHSVKVFNSGLLVRTWGSKGSSPGQFNRPAEIALGKYQGINALYVADTGNNRVQIFSLTGELLDILGEPTTDPLANYQQAYEENSFLLPYGVATDANNNIYISDTSHKNIKVYNDQGTLQYTLGQMSNTPGNFFSPMGLCVDSQTGKLFVADGVLQRIQIFTPLSP